MPDFHKAERKKTPPNSCKDVVSIRCVLSAGLRGVATSYFSHARVCVFFFFRCFRRGGRDLGCKWRQAEGGTERLLLQRISRIRCSAIQPLAIGCQRAAIHRPSDQLHSGQRGISAPEPSTAIALTHFDFHHQASH